MNTRASTALFLLLAISSTTAQDLNLRLPISLDADSTNYDGMSSMLMFRGLRLSQGTIGVEADTGRASKLDFKDSVWHFDGNVVIDVDNGHIECDSAALRFTDHRLVLATIEGKPATFEIRRPDSDDTTYAEAGQLKYDVARGVIEFSDNARITEGGNQISSGLLVYDIKERRVRAEATGEGDEKVKIIYTPADSPLEDENTDVPGDPAGSQDATAEADPGTEEPGS